MNAKTAVLTGLLVVGYVLPAAAQTPFFIVRDPQTKHCTIVDKKPLATETTTVVNPDGTTYRTRTEAEGAMGALHSEARHRGAVYS